MAFRLQGAPREAKPVQPPVVKDMVIKNGRFVKKHATAAVKRRAARTGKAQTAILPVAHTQPMQSDGGSGNRIVPRRSDENCQMHADYVESVVKAAVDNVSPTGWSPWVMPPDAHLEILRVNGAREAAKEQLLTPREIFTIAARPAVFMWAPTLAHPSLEVRCPDCHSLFCNDGELEWEQARELHALHAHAVLVATRHTCLNCSAAKLGRRSARSFSMSSLELMRQLPAEIQAACKFRITKQGFCDEALVDAIRAWATRMSWASAAATFNEMKATQWTREVVSSYLSACKLLGHRPLVPPGMPESTLVSGTWIRDVYLSDFGERQLDVIHELSVDCTHDIFVFDWTKDAGKRCGAKWMFNVMDGNGSILSSVLTSTTKPCDVEQVLHELKKRHADPKLVYVDAECCGEWRCVICRIWPNANVRLDAFHAIRRLTQTTLSTRHPWHPEFCQKLSEAVYTHDEGELKRLSKACRLAGVMLTPKLCNQHVPRLIKDPASLERNIDTIINEYTGKVHPKFGELVTTRTIDAWGNLRHHVQHGCLCDPENVSLNATDSSLAVQIGDESFDTIRSRRGPSALEGFHFHQKTWLGFATHSCANGLALVADGTVRWNRRRRIGKVGRQHVFAPNLLTSTDPAHNEYVSTGQQVHMSPVRTLVGLAGTRNALLGASVPKRGAPEERVHTQSPIAGADEAVTSSAKMRPARSMKAGCLICGMEGTACRRYRGIQWCKASGPAFDEWKSIVFPGKKHAAIAAAKKRAARATGRKGRPVRSKQLEQHKELQNEHADDAAGLGEEGHKLDKARRTFPSTSPATSRKGRCRICRKDGTQCRKYREIQWCDANGAAFDNWKVSTYPGLKAAAQAATHKRKMRATGKRGRPRNTTRASNRHCADAMPDASASM